MERPSHHTQLQRWCVSCDSSVVRDMGCENGNLSPCCCDQYHLRIPSPAAQPPPEQPLHCCPARCRGSGLQDESRRTWRSAHTHRCKGKGAGRPAQLPSCPVCATPWTAARQAPLSVGFPRQEDGSRLPFAAPGDLLDPWMDPSPWHQASWRALSLWCVHILANSPSMGAMTYLGS